MLIKEEPVYELELAPRRDEASARAAHLVLHGALDLVDSLLFSLPVFYGYIILTGRV